MTCIACYGSGSILTVMDIATGYTESEPCPLCTQTPVDDGKSTCVNCGKRSEEVELVLTVNTAWHSKSESLCRECRKEMGIKEVAA